MQPAKCSFSFSTAPISWGADEGRKCAKNKNVLWKHTTFKSVWGVISETLKRFMLFVILCENWRWIPIKWVEGESIILSLGAGERLVLINSAGPRQLMDIKGGQSAAAPEDQHSRSVLVLGACGCFWTAWFLFDFFFYLLLGSRMSGSALQCLQVLGPHFYLFFFKSTISKKSEAVWWRVSFPNSFQNPENPFSLCVGFPGCHCATCRVLNSGWKRPGANVLLSLCSPPEFKASSTLRPCLIQNPRLLP